MKGLAMPLACSVCFGDPNSYLAKGALAGVFLLLGVVVFVLAGIAVTALTWARRAKRLDSPLDRGRSKCYTSL